MAAPSPATTEPATSSHPRAPVRLPRVTIEFCTQCKWNLRAAYYAQELLQTFSTALGEVSLLPASGGTFVIRLYTADTSGEGLERTSDAKESGLETKAPPDLNIKEVHIWDRKVDSGFPETKELKNRIRNVIDPSRDMGHTDRALKKQKDAAENSAQVEVVKKAEAEQAPAEEVKEGSNVEECADCKP